MVHLTTDIPATLPCSLFPQRPSARSSGLRACRALPGSRSLGHLAPLRPRTLAWLTALALNQASVPSLGARCHFVSPFLPSEYDGGGSSGCLRCPWRRETGGGGHACLQVGRRLAPGQASIRAVVSLHLLGYVQSEKGASRSQSLAPHRLSSSWFAVCVCISAQDPPSPTLQVVTLVPAWPVLVQTKHFLNNSDTCGVCSPSGIFLSGIFRDMDRPRD